MNRDSMPGVEGLFTPLPLPPLVDSFRLFSASSLGPKTVIDLLQTRSIESISSAWHLGVT